MRKLFPSLSNQPKPGASERIFICANQWILIRIMVFPSSFSDAILLYAHLNRLMETHLMKSFLIFFFFLKCVHIILMSLHISDESDISKHVVKQVSLRCSVLAPVSLRLP